MNYIRCLKNVCSSLKETFISDDKKMKEEDFYEFICA